MESTVTFGSAEALGPADGPGACAEIPEAMLPIRVPATIIPIFIRIRAEHRLPVCAPKLPFEPVSSAPKAFGAGRTG